MVVTLSGRYTQISHTFPLDNVTCGTISIETVLDYLQCGCIYRFGCVVLRIVVVKIWLKGVDDNNIKRGVERKCTR